MNALGLPSAGIAPMHPPGFAAEILLWEKNQGKFTEAIGFREAGKVRSSRPVSLHSELPASPCFTKPCHLYNLNSKDFPQLPWKM